MKFIFSSPWEDNIEEMIIWYKKYFYFEDTCAYMNVCIAMPDKPKY